MATGDWDPADAQAIVQINLLGVLRVSLAPSRSDQLSMPERWSTGARLGRVDLLRLLLL
jgi:hypothetical protein